MANGALTVTPAMLQHLVALKAELKFGPDEKTAYTGIFDPADRAAADNAFGRLVDDLVTGLPGHPSKQFVLERFGATLSGFSSDDTEDRERAATYCERIMDVLGIASSEGVLNRWLYGDALGLMLSKPKEP